MPKRDSALGDLEHARHLLDRVQMFVAYAETIESDNHDERRLALIEAASDTLTSALERFDCALRELGASWRRADVVARPRSRT